MSPTEIPVFDLVRVSFSDGWNLTFEVSPWIVVPIILAIGVFFFWTKTKRFRLVELDISLGNIGTAKFKPNRTDIQIAHKIWTELVTRKAALKIDPEHDVIVEVYDSWYALFQIVREQISEIPAELIRDEDSTKKLIEITTKSLNDGLRPHLTKWQSRFRNWYKNQEHLLKKSSPQEVQKQFPDYAELLDDMIRVNQDLIGYAAELKKITDG